MRALTSGTQSKVTVPLFGKVAQTQLTTVPSHGELSGLEPNTISVFSFGQSSSFLIVLLILNLQTRGSVKTPTRTLPSPSPSPQYLPVVAGLAAVDPPQVVVLQAEEADQAGDVWRGPALSCPDWHHPVDRVVAVTGPATRQAENQQPEDGGEKKNLR